MTELETKLRNLASEGLISHLSVYARWGAHTAPTIFSASLVTPYGQGHAEHEDLILAVNDAIDRAPKEQQKKVQQPAPVVREPVKPPKALKENRTTPQGQTSVPVPNLMELFNEK